MEVSNTLLKIAASALGIALLLLISLGAIQRNSYESDLAKLRNAVASKDVTIETQLGVYHKLTMEMDDLRTLANSKDGEIKRLSEELKKNKEDLLTATTLSVKWKKAYEASIKGSQTEVPGTNGVVRKKVTFEKDFGYIGVQGYTLTDPPEAWVKIAQNRPLRLGLFVSQDKSGAWHTRATSSEENVGIDIELTGVNPYLLTPKWYEKIGIVANLGVGANGVLAGAGLSYKIDKFDVGPTAWVAITDKVSAFYGANFTWHPFQR